MDDLQLNNIQKHWDILNHFSRFMGTENLYCGSFSIIDLSDRIVDDKND